LGYQAGYISVGLFEADIRQFVAKLFSGIGVGSLQFITPTYVSEVAPPRIRGMLLVLYNFW
jgi:MFS family permease